MKKNIALLSLALAILATNGWFTQGFRAASAQTTGPVAYWKFDEGSGTTAFDSSGSGNTATAINTSWTTGKIGSALQFNGLNSYVRFLSILGGKGWQGDYTVALWVKAPSVGQYAFRSVFNNAALGTTGSFQIDVDGGNPGNYRLYTTKSYPIAPVTTDWQFLTVTLSGTTLKTYNNGVLTNIYTLAAGESNFFRDYLIGVNRAYDTYFQGTIDEVSIYNRALSAAEVQALSGIQSPGSLQFSAAAYSVQENGGSATITVTRTGGSTGAVGVSFATSNGTATAGSDYTATSQTVTFADGDAVNKTVSIPILDDTIFEGNETVNLTLSNPTGGATLGSPSTAVLTIVDNESSPKTPPVAYWRFDEGIGTTALDSSGSGNTATVFNASWTTGKLGGALQFNGLNSYASVSSIAGGAWQGDYTLALWVKAGSLGQFQFSGIFSNATLATPDSFQIEVDGGNPGNYRLNTYHALYTIAPVTTDWQFLTVTLSGTTLKTFNNGILTNTYTLAAGESNFFRAYLVGVNRGGDAEVSQTIYFQGTIDEVQVYNRALSPAEIQILSGMAAASNPGTLQFSAATYSVQENGGSATITVTRTGGSAGAVGVSFATSSGTATAGSDYTATTQTVTFADGDTANKTVTVPILDDTIVEGNETVNLTLSNPTGGATLGSPSTAVLTIVDNEAPPAPSATPLAYWKFDEGSGTAAFDSSGSGNTATLVNTSWTTGKIGGALQFNGLNSYVRFLSILGGKGWQGDYTVALWVKAGAVGQYAFKSVFINAFTGGAGSFQIDVDGGNPGNYRLYTTKPYIIAPVTTGWQFLAVTLSGTTLKTFNNGVLTNTYTLAAGEANFFRDYLMGVNRSGDAFFQGTIDEVRVYNSALSEPDILALSGIQSPGSLQFSAAAYSVQENGGSAPITVTRTGGSTGAVGVSFATSNGTATAGSDYTATTQTVTFADGDTANKTVTVPILDDTIVEGNETVNLTLSNPTGGATLGSPSTAVLTIIDNEPAPPAPGSLQFSAATYSVQENGGSATITVTRTGGSAGAVGVSFATSSGTATAGSDYTATTQTVTFADGDTANKTVTVPILDDTIVEGNETVNLTLSSPTGGATLGSPSTAVLTIVDNEAPPAIPIAYWKFDEGSGTAAFDSSGSGNTATLVNTSWTTGKIGGALQFNGLNSYVRFLSILGGKGWQGDYTVALWVKAGAVGQYAFKSVFINAFTGGAGSFQIDVDGGNPGNYRLYTTKPYIIAPVTTGWQFLAVTLSGTTLKTFNNGVLTNTYTLAAGEANFFRDYLMGVNRSGDAFFQGTIDEVRVYNSALSEPDILALSGIQSPGSLQFSAAAYSVQENGGSAPITVTRTGGSTGAVGVSFATSNGTATAGSDYTATTQTVTFADGDAANKTVSIPILDDTIFEGNETVNLTLSNPTGGATLGSPSTAVLTIIENDPAPPSPGSLQFSSATYSVQENGGSATITVTRTGGSAGAVGVSFATSNGTATAGTNYTTTTQTVTFANGDIASKTVAIPIIHDNVSTGNQTVNLTLSNPTGGATLSSPSTAVLTIVDTDGPPPNPPLAYWKFDEGSGTTSADASGFGNTATLVNTSWTTGKIGGGLLLNGINSYAKVSPLPRGAWRGDYTVSLWVKAGALGQRGFTSVFSNFSGGGTADSLQIDVDGTNPGNYRVSTLNAYNIAAVTASWQFLTITLNGTKLQTYNNGILTNTYTVSAGESNFFRDYLIALNRGLNVFFQGTIDEVRIYNRALSAAEIQGLYISTTPELPLITNVGASQITTTNAAITWTTDRASDSLVEYGFGPGYGYTTAVNSSLLLSHLQSLSGLIPNATYHYRVKSKDASGNVGVSPDFTFVTPAATGPRGAPNIILILTDDLGWQGVGAYGQPLIQTPNIDELAREGMLFTQAYANTVCTPTRSSLITGQHTGHTRLRMTTSVDPITGVPSDDPGGLLLRDATIPEVLKAAHYKSALFGKWHTGSQETSGRPTFSGFDYFLGHLIQGDSGGILFPSTLRENDTVIPVAGAPNVYVEDLYTQKAIDFITQNSNNPFFLYLSYNTPHNPYGVPSLDPYSSRSWDLTQKTFAAMMTRLDTNIGKVMATLSNLGLDQNTLVIFTSDNGTEDCCSDSQDVDSAFHTTGPLRGYKQSLYEGGIRVPFIARWPGAIPPGTFNNDLITLWDLLPTFAELANVPPSRGIDGISLVPTLFGTANVSREYLYFESFGAGGLQAIRMGDWKGIRNLNFGFELYNLASDLGERNNVATSNPSIVNKMAAIMNTGRNVSADGFPLPAIDPFIICRQRELLNGVELLSYSGSSPSCAHLAAAVPGERAYTDLGVIISALPSAYANQVLLRHANADKTFPWSTFARLALRQASTVAVAYDSSATVLPSWLQSWTRTGEVVRVSGFAQGDLTLNIYAKSFPQNATVFLGGNAQDGGNGTNSYLVLVNTNTVTQPPTGLVAYWKFDEPSGPIALDASGYDYDGILYNGGVIGDGSGNGPSRVAGKVGGGLSFNGINNFVYAATGDTWKGDYTVTLWVKASRTAQSVGSTLLANAQNAGGNTNRDSFQIDVDGGSPGNYQLNSINRYPIAPVTTNWQFLSVTLNGTTLRTYNNGVLTNTYTLSVDESNFFRSYLIGVNRQRSQFFQGTLDEVRVYNRALSAAEIQALFTSTN